MLNTTALPRYGLGGVTFSSAGGSSAPLALNALRPGSDRAARALPRGFVALGEVGLAGEVRPAPPGQERLKEAAKLGFSVSVVPKANAPRKPIEGLTSHAALRIEQAIEVVRGL